MGHKREFRWRDVLSISASFAQVVIALIAIIGLIYSVIPAYRLSNLESLIESKQEQLNKETKQLGLAEAKQARINEKVENLEKSLRTYRTDEGYAARRDINRYITNTAKQQAEKQLEIQTPESLTNESIRQFVSKVDAVKTPNLLPLVESAKHSVSTMVPIVGSIYRENLESAEKHLDEYYSRFPSQCSLSSGPIQVFKPRLLVFQNLDEAVSAAQKAPTRKRALVILQAVVEAKKICLDREIDDAAEWWRSERVKETPFKFYLKAGPKRKEPPSVDKQGKNGG